MNVLNIVNGFLSELDNIMEKEKNHSNLVLIHKLRKNAGQRSIQKEIQVYNNFEDIINGIYELTKEDHKNLITPERLKFKLYQYNNGYPVYELYCIKKEKW